MTSIGELADALEESSGVEAAEITSPLFERERYISCRVQLAGLDLHTLHDEYDFEIRSAWHDPTTGLLSYAIWPDEELGDDDTIEVSRELLGFLVERASLEYESIRKGHGGLDETERETYERKLGEAYELLDRGGADERTTTNEVTDRQ